MAIAPAISSPLAPARQHKDQQVMGGAWSFSASACSNAPRIFFRIDTTSARLFNPGMLIELIVSEVTMARALFPISQDSHIFVYGGLDGAEISNRPQATGESEKKRVKR